LIEFSIIVLIFIGIRFKNRPIWKPTKISHHSGLNS